MSGEFEDLINDGSLTAWYNGTLKISRAERRHEGRYLCQASNGVGAGQSKVVSLHVHGECFLEHKTIIRFLLDIK